MALWYRSKVSPKRVNGHSNLCVINTRTEYAPIARTPSRVSHPPSSNVAVKPQRIAILIIGTNATESLIAFLFAFLYSLLKSSTRFSSLSSAVNDWIVDIPDKSFSRRAFNRPAVLRTSAYLGSRLLW